MESTLKFRLTVDTANGKAEIRGFSEELKHAGKDVQDIGNQGRTAAQTTSASFVTMGRAVTAFASVLAASKIVGWFGEVARASVGMAMDAVESENLFTVAMGDMASAARKWSEDLSAVLGLNEFELRKNIATFNTMFTAMGMGRDEAFKMAKSLTQLGYDFASFRNLKPEDAFLKLQAAITGEVEPLKRLGYVVNETTIKQWALKNGLIKQGQELTEQQKIVARYNVIMEQMKDVHGDLARTIDSPANAMRVLRSQVDELMTKLGFAFLPVLQTVVGIFNELLGLTKVNSDGMKTLAKVVATPLLVFLEFQKASLSLALSLLEVYDTCLRVALGMDKIADTINPLYKSVAPELNKQLEANRQNMINVANSAAWYEEKAYKLRKAVEEVGKTAAATNVPMGDLGESTDELQKQSEALRQEWEKEWMKKAAKDTSDLYTATQLCRQEDEKWLETLQAINIEREIGATKAVPLYRDAVREFQKEEIKGLEIATDLYAGLPVKMGTLVDAEKAAADAAKKHSEQFEQAWAHALGASLKDFTDWFADVLSGGNSFAKSLLSVFMQQLFSPLFELVAGVGKSFSNMLTGLLSGKGGGFSLSGILGGSGGGGGGLGGLLKGGGGLAGLIGGGLGSWGASATGAAAMTGEGIVGASGLLGMIHTVAAAVPVWGWAVAGIAAGVAVLWKAFSKNPAEEFAKDLTRDFGGVTMAKQGVEEFGKSLGLTMKQVDGIRKDLQSSPIFLRMAYDAAEAQGKTEEFLRSLENIQTAWGSANFRAAFEKGIETGSWDDLNKAFEDLFGVSERLRAAIPDLSRLFLENSDAANEAAQSADRASDSLRGAGNSARDAGVNFSHMTEEVERGTTSMRRARGEVDNTARAMQGVEPVNVNFVMQWRAIQAAGADLADELYNLAGELLLTKDAGEAQKIAWELMGDAIVQLVEQYELMGLTVPPLIQQAYDYAKANGLIADSYDDVRESADRAARSVQSMADAEARAVSDARQSKADASQAKQVQDVLAKIDPADQEKPYQQQQTDIIRLKARLGLDSAAAHDLYNQALGSYSQSFLHEAIWLMWNLKTGFSEAIDLLKKYGNIPGFAEGGPVTRTGLALVHQGEYVVPRGRQVTTQQAPVQIIIEGPIYGMDDLEGKVAEAWDRTYRRGGFSQLQRAS